MRGFFSDTEIVKLSDRKIDPENSANCNKCGLYRSVKTPKMKVSGRGGLGCLLFGEAPGGEEDQFGSQFAKLGKAGAFLRSELSSRGLDLDGDFYKHNVVNCRPTESGGRGGVKNRTPTPEEVVYCRPLVDKAIQDFQPKVIWLMGASALESFYRGKLEQHSIGVLRGLAIPDRKHNAIICPLYHPSYMVREDRNENLQACWKHDLDRAIAVLRNPSGYWPEWIEPKVEIIRKLPELLAALEYFREQPEISIDYETSGIKPYKPGHFIASMAMTAVDGSLRTIAFPLERVFNWTAGEFRQIKMAVRAILSDAKIKKVGQNIKFENIWSNEVLGIDIKNQWWDTMICAHILDNRSYFTGLKLQTYINFGFYSWNESVDNYLTDADKEGFNKIHKAPLSELLLYNGLDTFWTARLKQKQCKELSRNEGLFNAFGFFMDGQAVFSRYELRGMAADEEYFAKTSDDLTKQINSSYDAVLYSPEFQQFKKAKGRYPDIDSSDDIRELVYNVCGKEVKSKTEKDKAATDAAALMKTECSFVPDLIKYRKLEKAKGTYISQFLRYNYSGLIRTTLNLHNMLTYRSSSDTPNLMNVPMRVHEIQQLVRRGIRPYPGFGLLSSDLSGIEVGIACCYHKDPNLISYVKDPTKDMHRDTICDICILPASEVTKDLRFHGKNAWVFAQFYGSYYGNCAPDLWERIRNLKTVSGVPVMEHLRQNKIKTYGEFEEHCKDVEDKFWNVRFPVYKKWKDNIEALYRKQGYIETYLGFRFTGPMTRNELCNYQTQGTAFHCLLWIIIEIERIWEEEKWKSVPCMEIHDEALTNYVPEELDHICDVFDEVATVKLVKEFPWILVPIRMEHEISEVDGNWADMKVYR